jgi:hypothetical protein
LENPDQYIDEVEIEAKTALQMISIGVLIHLNCLMSVIGCHCREETDTYEKVGTEERSSEGRVAQESRTYAD